EAKRSTKAHETPRKHTKKEERNQPGEAGEMTFTCLPGRFFDCFSCAFVGFRELSWISCYEALRFSPGPGSTSAMLLSMPARASSWGAGAAISTRNVRPAMRT